MCLCSYVVKTLYFRNELTDPIVYRNSMKKLFILLLSFSLATGLAAQRFTKIDLRPNGAIPWRSYELSDKYLLVMDRGDDYTDTLLKVVGVNPMYMLEAKTFAAVKDSLSHQCVEEDKLKKGRMVCTFYAIGKSPRTIILNQAWSKEMEDLVAYLNKLVVSKPEFKIGYEFGKFKKLMLACK